ncbi:hypothetical protein RD792_005391 [Penstemon davidsonii]|uniref:Uncharacterized protein n=1 Tax=Penstemon davidsonii TaxID=160366 RepID=A0ABR0DK10_9LAMI|nr:hypothetical protein RD792_005391 [Penstemon davidsonii]
MSSQRRLPDIIFLFPAIFLPFIVGAYKFNCSNDTGNYTPNSTYQTNLNTLLSNLSTNADHNSFYSASVGLNPDRANAILLCKADIQLDECRSCVQEAAYAIVTLCPNQRQAIIWLDLCMLRYSNESIFGTMASSPTSMTPSIEKAKSVDQFMTVRNRLLDDLRNEAAISLWKVAARNKTWADPFQPIFAFVQCTPDLTSRDCNNCLLDAAADLRNCCSTSGGGRVLAPSCFLRYETNVSFYNLTRLQELIAGEISEDDADEISAMESPQYDFGIIRAATNDFSDANVLGRGGFGFVYKGKLLNGQQIAVKRLSENSGQGNREFKTEVMLLARLQHRNLVRLKGFSVEGTEKLLIYEFVQNASLDKFIFDPVKRLDLDWDRRYKIINGIAKGLLYLHEDSRFRIIHRDLKAGNVLLDGEMNPKIADFGLARFVPDETQVNASRVVGTIGYVAPEYRMHGQFSVKSDVFSFGVLVLEIISGQRNNNFGNGENTEDLIRSAWRNWHDESAGNLIDPAFRDSSNIPLNILRCIHIGLLCVQENAADRPTMAFVVPMLNNFSITLPVPSEPAIYRSSARELNSQNAITELFPR